MPRTPKYPDGITAKEAARLAGLAYGRSVKKRIEEEIATGKRVKMDEKHKNRLRAAERRRLWRDRQANELNDLV